MIGELASLPLFHKLAGRTVVIVGDGPGADWKAELVGAAGARVARLAARAKDVPGDDAPGDAGRPWRSEDLAGAALAFGDFADADEGRAFIAAARAHGVPVNLIDNPAASEFYCATIVNRSPVVIAISTDGAAPVIAQSIRARIEAVLPRTLGAWGRAARAWRPWVKASLPFTDRRRFWEMVAERMWAGDDPATLSPAHITPTPGGRVALVGAGPGDPELLTLKAVRLMQSATVILHDDLVDARVLELARREARLERVGKRGGHASTPQGAIDARLVELARAGETVVRLKGGDPLMFGRATEELAAVRAAGFAVEIVPGITAAQGAAAQLGFSLTERGVARSVHFVTGHDQHGAMPAQDWQRLARPDATIVVYMPRGTIRTFIAQALAAGVAPTTPALAIADATRPGSAARHAMLADLEAAVSALDEAAPVLVIVGDVTRRASDVSAATSPNAATTATTATTATALPERLAA